MVTKNAREILRNNGFELDIVVSGPTGSGKTSMLMDVIEPALRAAGYDVVTNYHADDALIVRRPDRK